MDEVLPPDLKKRKGRGIDEYLSESLDIILSNPKLLIPFVPALLAILIYSIYILIPLIKGGSLFHPRLDFFTSKNFIILSIAVTLIMLLFSLIGMIGVSYFILKKSAPEEAIRFGVKRLPLALISYTVLLALLMIPYAPIVVVRNVPFIIVYTVIISILIVSPLFMLSPLIVEKSFPIIDSFRVYTANFKKGVILAILYSLASSAVSSLIPFIGSFLNILIVIPMFTAAYTLMYEEWKISKESLFMIFHEEDVVK